MDVIAGIIKQNRPTVVAKNNKGFEIIQNKAEECNSEIYLSQSNYKLTDINGDSISLTDFDSKIVLVEVWASWCGYCNTEAPGLNQLYTDYNDQNFEIVGISIDTDKSAWKNKVDSHNIVYTQVNAPLGFNSPVVEAYDVKSIPKMFLLNENGEIILITTKASEVGSYLSRILK